MKIIVDAQLPESICEYLKNFFKANAANIISILKNHSFIILEKNTIKILQ